MYTVVRITQGDKLGALWLTRCNPVLTGQLQGGLNRIGTTAAEQPPGHILRLEHFDQLIRQIVYPGVSDAIEHLVIRQLIHLLINSGFDFDSIVANIDVPQATNAIQQSIVINISDVVTIGRGNNQCDPYQRAVYWCLYSGAGFIGSYSQNYQVSDALIALFFTGVGYVLIKNDIPVIPIIPGMVLGPVFLTRFRQSMGISEGDLTIFITRPISLVLLSITILSIVVYISSKVKESK